MTNYRRSKISFPSMLLCIAAVLSIFVILGSLNNAEAAGVEKLETVSIDFKDFARETVEQDWWSDLHTAADENTKYIGSENTNTPMSSTELAAYDNMQQYLKNNCNWYIDESASSFKNCYFLKQLFINSSEDIPWGVSYYAWYSNMPERNKLAIKFDVPSAGWYSMDVSAYHEASSGGNTQATTGKYQGSGFADFYINDALIYSNYRMSGNNQLLDRNMGAVYLNAGENTLIISTVGDYNGGHSSGRRLLNLRSVEFSKFGNLYVETAADEQIDLTDSYLPFDGVLDYGIHTVSSANESVAKASVTENGTLMITGMKEGNTTITLYNNGSVMFSIPVAVIDSVSDVERLSRLSYTIDDSEAPKISYGSVAYGELKALTNFKNEISMSELLEVGDVYFHSNNTAVAKVGTETGDVYPIREGTAKISVYYKTEDMLYEDWVYVTVTDSTNLIEMTLNAPVDYVGVGNILQFSVDGMRASGCKANMGNYEVAYSVDDGKIASIDASGRLKGLREGAVTVTVWAAENGVTVTDSVQIDVVANNDLPGDNVFLDFTDGLALEFSTATLEKDGKQINRDLTVSGGNTLNYSTKHGIMLSSAKIGDRVAVDFTIAKDGWYCIETWGTLMSYGAVTDVYMDDTYVGVMDFNQGKNSTYGGNSIMNTIYLEAGVHTCILECTERGSYFLGKIICRAADDPSDMNVGFTTETQMLVGQTAEAILHLDTGGYRDIFTLKWQTSSQKPSYTNYCNLSSSNTSVVKATGSTLTAVAQGTAVITVTGEINGTAFTKSVSVTVRKGTVASAELIAESSTLKPNASSTNLVLKLFGTDGSQVSKPSGATVTYVCEDTSIASVSSTGKVTITGKEGSARVVCTITENGRQVQCATWITVTKGKTEPTIFTYEERANALENVSKYSWAANMKTAAVRHADFVVANLDSYYDNFIYEAFPRNTRVGLRLDPDPYHCRYCKAELSAKYSVYPWIVDPINNPWKITCPACKRDFPSNDFERYYKSGLGEDGRFHADKADDRYLVNELYPEMGEGWGVDNGFGYDTGRTYSNGSKEVHTYIAYYMHCVFDSLSTQSKNDMCEAITALQNAYLYTGNEKYGSAGAILLDRIADIYPEYDYYSFEHFERGKFVNAIWEAVTIGQCLAQAADAFWPAMDNDDVIAYLRERAAWKGVSASEITPEYVRNNVDTGILLEIRDACYSANNSGNFGMHQASMAYAAVALDRLPETKEMIDWIFRYGENTTIGNALHVTGGSVMHRLINDVTRDGIGSEGSNMYNPMWYQNLMEVADALDGYTRVSGVDLWKNPKFVDMFNPYNKLILCGTTSVMTGECGATQSYGFYSQADYMLEAFIRSGNRDIARGLYLANGNSVKNLHGNIFTKDPEAGIQAAILKIVEEDGEWVWNRSEMLGGYGIAILRNGPEVFEKGVNNDQFSDYWMFFGLCGGAHGEHEALNIGIEAFGMIASPTLGYPQVVTTADPERMQWLQNTVSHNTVVVNDKCQSEIKKNSFPLHFDDAGKVKVMDAESPDAYEEADIYRRTMVSVEAQENVYYAVDFFRVLGGSEHVYSFHAASSIMPQTEGLTLNRQAMGTYAGPDVPFGNRVINPGSGDAALNTGSGYSWLDNVYRDNEPNDTFSVDFELEDFRNAVMNSEGVRMKFTMLSEEPVTEVAIADGHPPLKSGNPDSLKYLLVRQSGNNGMDTLFTSIIQPYRDEAYIADAKLLTVVPFSGEERVAERAAALKVTLVSGREDYIMYSSNPDRVYSILDDGKEVLRFQGFTGVCSLENGNVVYAYGNETTLMQTASDAMLISNDMPRVTGRVADFTKDLSDHYTMTIVMDQPATADDLNGKYIYVENDGMENAAYEIFGAQVEGNTAVLDLYTQTLVRSYIDSTDMDKGYVYNISEGQSFSIPLGAFLQCRHEKKRVSYVSNGDGTHTAIRTCVACMEIVSESIVSCKDGSDSDTNCDYCGGKVEGTISKITIVGANMTLGNDLKMNFAIRTSDLKEDYVVKVTQEGKGTKILEPVYHDATFSKVVYPIAAKEMTDTLICEIYNADGYLISEPFSRTVRDYAMGQLNKTGQTETMKSLVVDMLNYGTEAQKNFHYHEDAYANAQITEEQQAQYATADVAVTNNQVKGTNYAASKLTLGDSILLVLGFRNYQEGMTAKVTFTDFRGREREFDAPVTKDGTFAAVTVNQIVLGDAKCDVNVTVYKADGSVHGTAVDSVASYVARTGDSGLNKAIMKLATSAAVHLLANS